MVAIYYSKISIHEIKDITKWQPGLISIIKVTYFSLRIFRFIFRPRLFLYILFILFGSISEHGRNRLLFGCFFSVDCCWGPSGRSDGEAGVGGVTGVLGGGRSGGSREGGGSRHINSFLATTNINDIWKKIQSINTALL